MGRNYHYPDVVLVQVIHEMVDQDHFARHRGNLVPVEVLDMVQYCHPKLLEKLLIGDIHAVAETLNRLL